MRLILQAWRDNDLLAFTIALGVVLAALLAIAALRYVVPRALAVLARRTATSLDDFAADAVAGTKLWLLLPVALHFGASVLELPARLDRAVDVSALAALVLQGGLWTTHLIRAWVRRKTRERTDGDAMTALAFLGFAARVVVWSVILLSVLALLGFNITALVAGMGIGGVAVALAVQNILGDLFASLSIVLDKPFVVGDFIVVDTLRGTVERIGIKTTRVRSLDGENLVFSNSDLLRSRIRNFRQMSERRIAFSIGVTYETRPEKLRAVVAALRAIVESREKTRFDRAHFKEYGDSALLLEVVYYVLDPGYNVYMDIQQDINFAILERFASEGIAFAYPTRTLHIVGGEAAA